MKHLYGAIVNVLMLMLNRTMVFAWFTLAVAAGLYLFANIAGARNMAQLLALVVIPLLSVWSARTAYSSKWSVFEGYWATPPWLTIVARYILFAALVFFFAALWYLSPLYDNNWENLLHTLGSSFMLLAIYYPVMYMLRGEKYDIDMLIFTVAAMGSIFGLAWVASQFSFTVMLWLIGLAYVVSLWLSVFFERLHRGRG